MQLEAYYTLWKEGARPGSGQPAEFPGWPVSGIAITGDFASIQNFVLRPIPGAGGAARRLRSRSFRVSAYTEMIARWCLSKLSSASPSLLYSAGGKFFIATRTFPDWQGTVKSLQSAIDSWSWKHFDGELVFHLGAAAFENGRIPQEELRAALQMRKTQPLREVLISSSAWNYAFFRCADKQERCDSCGSTRDVRTTSPDGERVCENCNQDEELGSQIPQALYARIRKGGQGALSALGTTMELCARKTDSEDVWLAFEHGLPGAEYWPLLRHLPVTAGRTMDFEEIANQSCDARNWLAYLRVDADHMGRQLTFLGGDALRTWSLSSLLNLFFTEETDNLLRTRFPNIYSVYGGGDDLFVIGPWKEVLDFAQELRRQLRTLVGDDLTFSAGGVSLAKPREHILTHGQLAAEELERAKDEPAFRRHCGRDQIRALGVTLEWQAFGRLVEQAKSVAAWLQSGDMPSHFLHQLTALHLGWNQRQNDSGASAVRWRPLLSYQIHRNLKSDPAREWARSLLRPQSDWPWADFVVRYALLAGGSGSGGGE